MEDKSLEEYRMKRTIKKECPECRSFNVFDTGARIGEAGSIKPGERIPKPCHLMYECRDCGKFFLLIGKR